MPHSPNRRSLSAVCCKNQQQQKTPRAQQCTSSPLIPCAHGKLNVTHHRTTPKPEIHKYHSAESRSCVGEKIGHQKRIQAAQQQQCGYESIQTRPVSTNSGSMEEECEYGLTRGTCSTARRLEVVAVAGLLLIYFVVCFGCNGISSCFFFSFSLVRTYTIYCK